MSSSRTSRNPSPKVRGRLIAICLGIAIAWAMGEVGLRLAGYTPVHVNPLRAFHVSDPVLGFRGRGGYAGWFQRPQFQVLVRHDEAGFRRQEHQRSRDGADRRVLVFGDSFTWGWGVAQGEVFTDRLSRRLPDSRIENLGINASGTVMQFTLFETEVLDQLSAGDVVVVMFFNNDFSDNVRRDRLHGVVEGAAVRTAGGGNTLGSPVANWFKRSSRIVNLAAFVWDRARHGRIRARAVDEAESLTAPGPPRSEMLVTRHYLRRFAACCAERGAEFLVVWIPDERNMVARTRGCGEPFHRAFRELVESEKLPFLDPTEEFHREYATGERPLYFSGDDHWTAAGHELMARLLAAHLARQR